jgi:ankyrin repeat protein/energy-coupling factor transporter ATP-binding protein EcfA2
MPFKKLMKPTIFIASPSDVSEERKIAARVCQSIVSQTSTPIETYWWERTRAWNAGLSWQEQIPRPSDPQCRLTVCIFGEKLGSPLAALKEGRSLPNDFVTFVKRKNLPIDLGSDPEKIPLTGSVFEFVDAWLGAEKNGSKVLLFLKGDASIKNSNEVFYHRNFGSGRYYETLIASGEFKNPETGRIYHEQKELLARFYDEVLFKSERSFDPRPFIDERQFESRLRQALEQELGRDRPIVAKQAFKRLASFDIGDHDAFFGRAQETSTIIEILNDADRNPAQRPFMVLHGRSGSGKSSLAKAGIAGTLVNDSGFVSAHRHLATVVTPDDLWPDGGEDDDSLHLLGTHLAKAVNLPGLIAELDRCERPLKPGSFAGIVQSYFTQLKIDGKPARFVLIFDQIERALVGQAVHIHERLGKLVEALDQLTFARDLWVIACIPSDGRPVLETDGTQKDPSWLGKWNELESVRNAKSRRRIIEREIQALTEDRYREIIVEPFKKLGIVVDESLITPLLNQVRSLSRGEIPALPLLNVALSTSYEAWERTSSDLPELAESIDAEERTSRGPEHRGHGRNSQSAEDDLFRTLQEERQRTRAHQLISQGNASFNLNLSASIQRLGDQAVQEFKNSARYGEEPFKEVLSRVLRHLVVVSLRFDDPVSLKTGGKPSPDLVEDDLKFVLPTKGAKTFSKDAKRLLEILAAVRLVERVQRDSFRLVHEQVLRSWQMAAEWLAKEKRLLLAYSDLKEEAERWRKRVRREPLIGEKIIQAEELYVAWKDSEIFTPTERALIHESIRHAFLTAGDTPQNVDRFARAAQVKDWALLRFFIHNSVGDNGQTYLNVNAKWGEFEKPLVIVAVEYGHTALIPRLVKAGADVRASDKYNLNIVHALARRGQLPLMKRLESHIGSSSFQSLLSQRTQLKGWTPLHLAAVGGSADMINFLISHGADRKVKTIGREEWPLHLAAQWGRTQAAAALLRRYKEEQLEALTVIETDNVAFEGYTPLFLSVRRGHAETAGLLVGELIKTGLNPIEQRRSHPKWGSVTVLHDAARLGMGEVITALMTPPPGFTNPFATTLPYATKKLTPLHLAAHDNQPGAISALVSGNNRAVNARDMNGNTPLITACRYASLECVKALLEAGATPTFRSDDGSSPLSIALRRGSVGIVSELLKQPGVAAPLFVSDDHGLRPIDHAISRSHPGILQALISGGDDTHRKNSRGLVPLHVAAAMGDAKSCAILAPLSDPAATTNVGRTALHIGAWKGTKSSFDEIFRHSKELISARDGYGWTPLHYACETGSLDIAAELIAEGAQIDAANKDGSTPLHIAAHDGHKDLIELLHRFGAKLNLRAASGATALSCQRRFESDPGSAGIGNFNLTHPFSVTLPLPGRPCSWLAVP